MGTPKIKLCGMMRPCDIDYANEAMPDYVGFIFANTRRKISCEQAKEFRTKLDPGIAAVGVFVDEDPAVVADLLNAGIIDLAQLHGAEDASYIAALRNLLKERKPLIKAAKVTGRESIEQALGLDTDYLLLDAYKKGVLGGSGESFNWAVLEEVRITKPWFLAGGLDIRNIDSALRLGAYGYDLSTGIESETDGQKVREKMIEIVRRIRNV